ncbi:MAG: SRPBCC family protein [Candidatus Acidiferrales bacterium]
MDDTVFDNLFGRLEQPLKRQPYFLTGVVLAFIKYLGDATLVFLGTEKFWTPLDYLNSVRALELTLVPDNHVFMTLGLVLWLVPFVWIGFVFTERRALDAGWSPWWAFGFFIPFVNYALMAALCLWPSSIKYAVGIREREKRESPSGFDIALAILSGIAFAVGMIWIAVVLKANYAFGLFIGAPVGMGAISGNVLCRKADASVSDLFLLTLATNFVGFGAVLVVAFDGLICVAMALPIAVPLTMLGALVGREVATGGRAIRQSATSAMVLIPLFALFEPAGLTGHDLHVVNSSIEINAPPEAIWPHLIEFQPIAPPTEVMFRAGVAFPIWTHTDGGGLGATRYCDFSTGSIVERITDWQPNHALGFDVVSQPAPMVEISPYRNLDPPHLHGYVRSKHGEFRLVPLPGGRTRLEGSSSYEIQMAPETYWSLWVDSTVHAIHMRVFRHIKAEVEAENLTNHASR